MERYIYFDIHNLHNKILTILYIYIYILHFIYRYFCCCLINSTPSEVDRRRGFIADLRRSKNSLSRMASGKDTYGSINRDQLYSGTGSGNNNSKNRNSWTPNQYEDPNTREKDTRSLLRQQEQMMAKQDQDLSELSRGIGDLKNIGVAIGEGVSLTSALLDDIGKGVDKTDGSLQKRTQKAKVLQKQVQGNCGLYVCIFLLIILLVFNISSKGFKNI